MKRLFIILAFVMLICKVSAINVLTDSVNETSIVNEIPIFKLYPTTNIWTFLKLDTRNGKIWQVQWNIEENKRFEFELSTVSQVWKDEEIAGRFVLYPTNNSFNYIMLDQINGKTYQVQWSQEQNKRFVIPIVPGLQY